MAKWKNGLVAAMESESDSGTQEVDQHMVDFLHNEQQIDDIDQVVEQTNEITEINTILSDKDKTTEEKAHMVLEHFYSKYNFVYNHSFESMCDQSSLNKIDKINNIATEGLISRMADSMSMLFKTNDAVSEQLKNFIDTSNEKQEKKDLIHEPGWGRVFNNKGSKVISANDVENYINQYSLALDNNFLKACDSLMEIAVKAKKINDSVGAFATSAQIDKAVDQIYDLYVSARDNYKIAMSKFPKTNMYKTDPDYEPLSKKQAVDLARKMTEIIDPSSKANSKFNSLIATVQKNADKYIKTSNVLTFVLFSFGGLIAKRLYKKIRDIDDASQDNVKLDEIVKNMRRVLSHQANMGHALLKYINSSLK